MATLERRPRRREALIDFAPMVSGLDERGIGVHRGIGEFLLHPVDRFSNILDLAGEVTLFLFINQLITGIMLALFYRPTTTDAFSSLQNITYVVPGGVWMRGLHVYGASAMVVTVFIHMCRVFWYGGYKKPRELTWVLGVILLISTLALSLTGYLLPWDQKAYFATEVTIKIAGLPPPPQLGEFIRQILQGGPVVGPPTLQRFFTIHVFLLPALITLLMYVHFRFIRAHGISEPL